MENSEGCAKWSLKMKFLHRITIIFAVANLIPACYSQNVSNAETENTTTTTVRPIKKGETVHLYLLAVPESAILNTHLKFRQDDEDAAGPTFAQTGQFIGQIVQGVLGGDFRPIFAGSVKFVEEPAAQQNLGSFLGTIAPALNLALREVYTRTQTALGIRGRVTTPKPTPRPGPLTQEPALVQSQQVNVANGNSTTGVLPSDYVLVEEGTGANKTVAVYLGNQTQSAANNEQILLEEYATLLAEQQVLEQQLLQFQLQKQLQQKQQQLLQQQQLALQQQRQQQQQARPPSSTTSWQYVLNQLHASTTTPEPLPFIRKTTPAIVAGGEDEDYEAEFRHKI